MQPSTGQLRFLLSQAFVDVEAAANRVSAFGLLNAVIGRKLVVPEVYDLMSRVQELMISSHVRVPWHLSHRHCCQPVPHSALHAADSPV
jgi:hypothetical protein